MALETLPRGKMQELLVKSQSSFSALASGNWTKTLFYQRKGGPKQPLEEDPVLGLGRTNDRDQSQYAPGLVSNDFDLDVPVDYNHTGLWLYAMFGAATVTGSGDPYTHVFKSGGEGLPWRSHEHKYGASLYREDMGAVASKLQLQMAHASGFQQATISFMGRSRAKNTSSQGGTPASAWARAAVAKALGVFKINDVVAAKIMSVDLTIDNNIAEQPFISGDAYRSGFDYAGPTKVSGTIRLRFVDSTYDDLADPQTALKAELLWQTSVSRSLSIVLNNARLEPTDAPVTGPGAIEQSFSFYAEQDASNPSVVATLISSVASYAI